MDQTTADVLTTAIQVGGALVGVLIGFVGGLLTERRRQSWEERNRLIETKRVLYTNLLAAVEDVEETADALEAGKVVTSKTLTANGLRLRALAGEAGLVAPREVIDNIAEVIVAMALLTQTTLKGNREAIATCRSMLWKARSQLRDELREDIGTGRLG